jgi:hypothetical protein
MMMQLITPYSNSRKSVYQQGLPSVTGASMRSGKSSKTEDSPLNEALKQSEENPKKILNLVKEWLLVNHPNHTLTDDQLISLLNSVKQASHRTADVIWQTVQQKVGGPLTQNNTYVDSLKQQIKDAITGGKTEVNKWLQAFVVMQYVPSTIVTIMTTIWINKELKKAKKITPKEEKLLNNQEIARQVVGAAIHCVQAVASFALVDGIALAGKKNHVVRNQAEQWLAKTEGWKGLNQAVGKSLHKTADGLQWSWNTLNEGHNKTGLSLAFVMISNLLSYGIMRPLLVNTTFLGITEATTTPPTTEKPNTTKAVATQQPSYVEQVRLSEVATLATVLAASTITKKPIVSPLKPVTATIVTNPTIGAKTSVNRSQGTLVEGGSHATASTHHSKHHHGRFHAQASLS